MPWAPFFEIDNSSNTEVIPLGSEKWCPLGVTGLPKDEIYIEFHRAPQRTDFLP